MRPSPTAEIWGSILDSIAKCEEGESTEARLARTQCAFTLLGIVFGLGYVGLFVAIDFWFAVVTILVALLAIGMAIPMIRAGLSLSFTGNWLTGVFVLGFTVMIYGEGGVSAHAAAWLAAAPLCGLMMISARAAWGWAFVTVGILTVYFVVEMMGVHFSPLYDPQWRTLVTGLGFLGLGPFLFTIALTFELTRERAVTAKVLAMSNLAIANRKLHFANQDKDHFLGIVAHDLRNPLGLVDAYSQMLALRDDMPPEALEQIGTIIKSSKRMAGILDDLLNLNAIEQGDYPLTNGIFELGGIAKECVESARFKANDKGTRVRIDIEHPLNRAQVDERALGQVLDNLISNAVKYSPAGSQVSVVSRQDNDCAILEVIDQGPGFTEDDRAKLFQRFSRLSARPTGGESSTGLGLSIVKRITEAMHGQVECLPGKVCGTCFRLSFPAVEPEAADGPKAAQKHLAQSLPVAIKQTNEPSHLEVLPEAEPMVAEPQMVRFQGKKKLGLRRSG